MWGTRGEYNFLASGVARAMRSVTGCRPRVPWGLRISCAGRSAAGARWPPPLDRKWACFFVPGLSKKCAALFNVRAFAWSLDGICVLTYSGSPLPVDAMAAESLSSSSPWKNPTSMKRSPAVTGRASCNVPHENAIALPSVSGDRYDRYIRGTAVPRLRNCPTGEASWRCGDSPAAHRNYRGAV